MKTASGNLGKGISDIGSSVGKSVNGLIGSVTGSITSGNFAANLAESSTGGLSSIAGSLSGLAKGATAGLSGMFDSAKGIAGSAFAAITSSFKSFKPNVPQNLKEIASASATQQASNEEQANSGVANQVAGELLSNKPMLANPLNKVVASASSAATSLLSNTPVSSLASGVNSLPGGAAAIGAVVGAAGSSLPNIPGVKQTTDLIKNTSAAVQNGISTASAALSGNVSLSAGAFSSIANKNELLSSNALTKGLAEGTQSLTALASSGLPAGAAASLQASLSSLSSSSPFPIKLPTIGANTTDRSDLTAQLGSVLGDKKIPTPNFGGSGPSSAAKAQSDKLMDLIKQQEALIKEKEAQSRKIDKARAAFIEARDNLPQGDPAIETAKEAYKAEVQAFSEITAKISDIANKA
jgi:hypothetical protein